jgi:hypothetical protein
MVYSGSAQGVVSLKALVELCQQAVRQQRPPDIAVLYAKVADCGGYLEFLRIVREFVPAYEQEILREKKPGLQMAKFGHRFEDKYFPLFPMIGDGELETYVDLTYRVPVNVLGLTEDEMGEPESFRIGIRLMLLLIDMENGQVPLAHSLSSVLPVDLIEQARPVSNDMLHKLLDGTEYEGLADQADIWSHQTGSNFLDCEDYDSWGSTVEWDKETIEFLTEDWQLACGIQERVFKLAEWLEENPADRFRQLLKFIKNGGKEDDGIQLPLGIAAEP